MEYSLFIFQVQSNYVGKRKVLNYTPFIVQNFVWSFAEALIHCLPGIRGFFSHEWFRNSSLISLTNNCICSFIPEFCSPPPEVSRSFSPFLDIYSLHYKYITSTYSKNRMQHDLYFKQPLKHIRKYLAEPAKHIKEIKFQFPPHFINRSHQYYIIRAWFLYFIWRHSSQN